MFSCYLHDYTWLTCTFPYRFYKVALSIGWSGCVVFLFNDSDHSLIHPDFYTQPITGHLLYCVIMILGSYICGKRVLHANMTELWSLWALTVFAFGSCLAEADLVQCQLVQAWLVMDGVVRAAEPSRGNEADCGWADGIGWLEFNGTRRRLVQH